MGWQALQQAKAAPTEERSEAELAFCSMILRQDNPARSLDEKWADLMSHMHCREAEHFRCAWCYCTLFEPDRSMLCCSCPRLPCW